MRKARLAQVVPHSARAMLLKPSSLSGSESLQFTPSIIGHRVRQHLFLEETPTRTPSTELEVPDMLALRMQSLTYIIADITCLGGDSATRTGPTAI